MGQQRRRPRRSPILMLRLHQEEFLLLFQAGQLLPPSARLHSANWVLLRNTAEGRRKRAPKEVRRPPPSVQKPLRPFLELRGREREGPRGMCERRERRNGRRRFRHRNRFSPSFSPSAHFSMQPSAAFRQRENNSSLRHPRWERGRRSARFIDGGTEFALGVRVRAAGLEEGLPQ